MPASSTPPSRAARACAALCFLGVLIGCGSSSSGGSGSTVAAATSNTAPVSSAATGSGSSALVAQGQVEVLTYNVAGLPQGISGSNPAVNSAQISPKLNAYELVLVQEDFFYHGELRRQTTHPHESTPQPIVSSRPVNDGLNRFSLSPWTAHDRVTWTASFGLVSNGSDELATKGYSFARHELAPGVELDVYNLHADAGGDAGDENARALQFAQLAQDLLVRSAGRAVLVAGDTNLKAARPRDAQVLNDFLGVAGLRDCAREVGNAPELIDRIMVRDGGGLRLRPTQWRTAGEFIDAQGAALSDHAAVHVTVAWELYR